MKTRSVTLCLLLIAGPGLAQAPDGVTLERFLARRVTPMIGALDANHDGKISRDELAGLSARAKPGSRAQGETLFSQMDKDHDGAVSRAELEAALTARFRTADANHDGVLSPEEQQAAVKALRPGN